LFVISTDAFAPPIPDTLGAPSPCRVLADPFAALDDLMYVVETLCPVWPPKPIEANGHSYKL
jgi:hypothetical protein